VALHPLARAEAALAAGRDDEALDALARAWRERRDPELAALAALVDARSPSVLRRSLDGVLKAFVAPTLARLAEVAEQDHPLLSGWVLDRLLAPPFVGPAVMPLLRALLAIAERLRDPRVAARAPEIAQAWKALLRPVRMSLELRARLDQVAMRIAREPPRAATAEELRLQAAIAERLRPQVAAARTAEDLFAEVYAHPDDDGPRQVLADFLQERGDPRGELIALQLSGNNDKRVDELLEQHGKRWLAPLLRVLAWSPGARATRFARGFLSVAHVYSDDEQKIALVADDPMWSTVERLTGHWPPLLLERAPLRALRRIDRAIAPDTVERLHRAGRTFLVERLELLGPLSVPELAVVFPRLEELTVWAEHVPPAQIPELAPMKLHRLTVERLWNREAREAQEDHQRYVDASLQLPAVTQELWLLVPPGSFPRAKVELRRDGERYLRRSS
jgi:uncharacterized protein (TIGR02996 family)